MRIDKSIGRCGAAANHSVTFVGRTVYAHTELESRARATSGIIVKSFHIGKNRLTSCLDEHSKFIAFPPRISAIYKQIAFLKTYVNIKTFSYHCLSFVFCLDFFMNRFTSFCQFPCTRYLPTYEPFFVLTQSTENRPNIIFECIKPLNSTESAVFIFWSIVFFVGYLECALLISLLLITSLFETACDGGRLSNMHSATWRARFAATELGIPDKLESVQQEVLKIVSVSFFSEYQGQTYNVWHVDGTQTAHDAIDKWRAHEAFNKSIAVTKLLSDADASALHDHFVSVEVAKVDAEIAAMELELGELQKETDEGPTWPAAVPAYSRPPNRYQVPTWEFFTLKDIFRSEPNQNVRPLEGKDRDDVLEVVAAARQHAEAEEPDLEFLQVRNGYRLFDPQRGMDYMVDLVYKDGTTQATVERRVHLCRMVAGTQLMNQVPYVKEDTDMTIVVPVGDESEVLPARRLLARHARLCTAPAEETRKTRVVVALLPGIDPRSATNIGNDLEELKRRCKRSGLESDLLQLQGLSGNKVPDGTSGDVGGGSAALDEAIDRYGSGSIFLLLSPYADIQKEFLDRSRINTIKHYQVFFPIPFVEYHPTISGMDVEEHEVPADQKEAREAALARLRDSSPPKRKRPLIVQKDHGRFDSLDFSCMAVYGSDYVAMRPKLSGKRLDLITAFLNQDEVHVLRAIEPTLRIRGTFMMYGIEPALQVTTHYLACENDWVVVVHHSTTTRMRKWNFLYSDMLASLECSAD
ncbi:unnamed protein product [Cylicocyclus nassatus]|uniref:Hexosyltransferase n=1 Tax=Cylicocyclus nassatus TaxID=53992 RepID=A0AA36GYG8_CYLNA|nr:unnamed protein product [Cylicocyclus nassatus]